MVLPGCYLKFGGAVGSPLLAGSWAGCPNFCSLALAACSSMAFVEDKNFSLYSLLNKYVQKVRNIVWAEKEKGDNFKIQLYKSTEIYLCFCEV